ncbi:hypothetical protein L0152_12925 [bacterium]|nr:hypothetical protein [bacterium]
MNQIKPEKWSNEWYELATTDELILTIKEARHLLKLNSDKVRHQRSIWVERIRRISEELNQREIADEEFEEL